MQMGVSALVRRTPPTQAELDARFAEQRERWVVPATLELWHVFFAREPDGSHAARAARALARIRAGGLAPEAALAQGDPFLRGHHLAGRSLRDLEGVFGPGLPERVFDLPLATWSEPLESAYGLHLVWVAARVPERAQPLEEVRSQVEEEVYARREREELRAALDEARERYEVRVASAPEATR
jgi:hypothetical protein